MNRILHAKEEIETKVNGELEEIPADMMDEIFAGEGENQGYACKYCGRTFKTITAVAAHVATAHRK